MNARLTLITAATLVLASAGLALAQTPTPAAAPVASTAPAVYEVAPQATPTQAPKVVSGRVTVKPDTNDQQAPPAPPAPPTPPAPATAPKVQMPKVVKGQLVNLKLEFTITDQIGSATPVKKTVTMNVADGESGRIRTSAIVYRKGSNTANVPLSIDAAPEIEGTKIRLRASLEYQLLTDAPTADVPGGMTSISQSVTSILNDGVQAILSQSADPLNDRKVTLEVKATIIK